MGPQYRIQWKRMGTQPVMCLTDSPFNVLYPFREGLAKCGLAISVSGAWIGLRKVGPEGLWYQGSHEVPAVGL